MARPKAGDRVSPIYEEQTRKGLKYRVIVYVDGAERAKTFDERKDAEAYAADAQAEIDGLGGAWTVEQAIEAFREASLAAGNKASTVRAYHSQARTFFAPALDRDLSWLCRRAQRKEGAPRPMPVKPVRGRRRVATDRASNEYTQAEALYDELRAREYTPHRAVANALTAGVAGVVSVAPLSKGRRKLVITPPTGQPEVYAIARRKRLSVQAGDVVEAGQALAPIERHGYAVDYHRCALKTATRLLWWCVEMRKLASNPLEGVDFAGKRKRRKAQLGIDEGRAFRETAFRLADAGHEGAVAVLLALLLGLRQGEVTARRVGDLDDGGTVLVLTDTKTPGGDGRLRIPSELRGYLQRLAAGRPADAPLFRSSPEATVGPSHMWLNRWTKRICTVAGVGLAAGKALLCAHSLRGMRSSYGVVVGESAEQVAALLRNGPSVAVAHYIDPQALRDAEQQRLQKVLAAGHGGREAAGYAPGTVLAVMPAANGPALAATVQADGTVAWVPVVPPAEPPAPTTGRRPN